MTDQPQGGKPALTVVVQSWWTPALAVIMLVVGLLAGYFGRPLVARDSAADGDVAAANTPAATTAPIAQGSVPTSTTNPTLAGISNQEQLMAYLTGETTHFLGEPDAEVVIIEFSDFQ
jgi:hypothetical protein